VLPLPVRNKLASQKVANRAHARLRAPGERANAQLQCWPTLRKLRCCPAAAPGALGNSQGDPCPPDPRNRRMKTLTELSVKKQPSQFLTSHPYDGRDGRTTGMTQFHHSKGVQAGDNNVQINVFTGEGHHGLTDGKTRDLPPAGRLIAELLDPFSLEVHRPINVHTGSAPAELPVLPPYIRREHDMHLTRLVAKASTGSSAIGVLVGESSTGKTRACWEAIQPLPPHWRVWHPIFPERSKGLLAELGRVGPNTVVWLNEAQLYLLTTDPHVGEQAAAGVAELLRDPARSPVLVLGTIWPGYWDQLTRRASNRVGPDPHASARMLLEGTAIRVPDRFDGPALSALSSIAEQDPRLADVAVQAADGQVTQFLAGAPALLERYRTAPAAARAVIHAAMDALRLGMRPTLACAFLEAAAPAYLTEAEWNSAGEDWLEQALAYTAAPCKGVLGPLTRIRPRPAGRDKTRHGTSGEPGTQTASLADGKDRPIYRLADYLDQHGRRHRNDKVPPEGFWAAAIDHADPGDQIALGDAARGRGLLRQAAQLYKYAAARGDSVALPGWSESCTSFNPPTAGQRTGLLCMLPWMTHPPSAASYVHYEAWTRIP
jgi:hypothetical protein